MIRLWHVILFVVALVVFAVSNAPVSFFVKSTPSFRFVSAKGSVWDAAFEGVSIGDLDAGRIALKVNPLDVLQGKAIVDVAAQGRDLNARGALLANIGGDRRIVVSSGRVAVNVLPNPASIEVVNFDAYFSKKRCVSVTGSVTTNLISRNSELFRASPVSETATLACEGEAAVVRWLVPGVAGTIELRLHADGSGQGRLALASGDERTSSIAGAIGMQRTQSGFETVRAVTWFPF